ncbi:MAG: zinc ribbon domain-containing protein [Puniceicoccaceae bacterium]|nr:MAG: zinc ribbon domain-containing protein [Puniceicoccaceae bacterium]
MATYVYETIPTDKTEAPKLYEIEQSMKEPALTKHPETGEAIRRVILGGYGLMTPKKGDESCGPGCGCC